MSRADHIETWLRAEVEPEDAPMGPGHCVVVTRKSPDRAEEAPNEDGAAVLSWGSRACVLALADGLGGYGDGDVAAEIMLTTLAKTVGSVGIDGVQAALLAAIDAANEELRARPGQAATTLLVATVEGRRFRSYHAGDSELLVVGQRGKIKHQTVSHSPVGYAVEAGMLDPEEGLEHEQRHIISNFIGMQGMRIELTCAIELAPRDTVVLGSDGLWDNVHVHEVVECVRKGALDRAARQLVELASQRMGGRDPDVAGKLDDLTAILFRLGR